MQRESEEEGVVQGGSRSSSSWREREPRDHVGLGDTKKFKITLSVHTLTDCDFETVWRETVAIPDEFHITHR